MAPPIDYQNKSYESYWAGEHMRILKDQEGETITRLLKPAQGWFLEAGCGYGRLYPHYGHLFPLRIMLDQSLEELQRFKERHQEAGLYLVAADACALPFRDCVFETVLGIRLIQDISDPNSLVASLTRVLTPHGRMLVSYFNRRNLLRIFKFGISCFHTIHRCEHKVAFGEMYATHPRLFDAVVSGNHLKRRHIRGTGFTYQISNNSKKIQRLAEHNPLFSKLLCITGRTIDAMLGPMGFSLWEICDLEKEPTGQDAPAGECIDINDVLQCPGCAATDFEVSADALTCSGCGRIFPIRDGIYDFRLPEGCG